MSKYSFLFLIAILALQPAAQLRAESITAENLNNVVADATSVVCATCQSTPTTSSLNLGTFKSIKIVDGVFEGMSVISEQQLAKFYQKFKDDPALPFKYPEDGCYARAHYMSKVMETAGIKSGKIFVYGNLRVQTPYPHSCKVQWWYHVTPTVKVRTSRGIELRVIDPSILSAGASPEQWVAEQSAPDQADVEYTTRFSFSPHDNHNSDWVSNDLSRMESTLTGYQKTVEERIQRAPPDGKECNSQ